MPIPNPWEMAYDTAGLMFVEPGSPEWYAQMSEAQQSYQSFLLNVAQVVPALAPHLSESHTNIVAEGSNTNKPDMFDFDLPGGVSSDAQSGYWLNPDGTLISTNPTGNNASQWLPLATSVVNGLTSILGGVPPNASSPTQLSPDAQLYLQQLLGLQNNSDNNNMSGMMSMLLPIVVLLLIFKK